MRVVSLVPGATDAVAFLGHGAEVVGRSHLCDHPAAAHAQVVTAHRPGGGLDPAGMGTAVHGGDPHTPFALDGDALASLEPDVVFAQSTCAVCAPTAEAVEAALCEMPTPARVVRYDPARLSDVIDAMVMVGKVLDDKREGLALASHAGSRLKWTERAVAGRTRPRVALVEWPDPIYAPGHWGPDLIEAAGGTSVIGQPGTPSQPVSVAAVAAARPDVVVLGFCGLDLAHTQQAHEDLDSQEGWRELADETDAVYAIDGSRLSSRPGPRLVDGVEALAWALHRAHPDLEPPPGAISRKEDGGWRDLGR